MTTIHSLLLRSSWLPLSAVCILLRVYLCEAHTWKYTREGDQISTGPPSHSESSREDHGHTSADVASLGFDRPVLAFGQTGLAAQNANLDESSGEVQDCDSDVGGDCEAGDPAAVGLQLIVSFTSATSGFVQSPVLEGRYGTNFSDQSINSTVRIDTPEKHVVCISLTFLHPRTKACVHLSFSNTKVYVGSLDIQVWNICPGSKRQRPRLEMFETDAIYITFSHKAKGPFSAFKLLFSFHLKSALLEQLPGGKWNCSVPHWPEFRQHMRCNMLRECEGGEDEVDCGYESEDCGPGLISAAGSCYLLENFNGKTNDEASVECQRRGGYLVSLNTPEEWKVLSQLMLERIPFDYIFVGLRFNNPTLPQPYRSIPMWSDGTVAYFLYHQTVVDTDNGKNGTMCGVINYLWYEHNHEVFNKGNTHCSTRYERATLMCEIEPTTEKIHSVSKETVTEITVSNVTLEQQFPTQMVECPLGYKTHTFLACDVESACWGRGYGSRYSCDAPLTSFPPSFPCANGYEVVPYTLVCDFRPDCSDESDEDFCFFEPCDVDMFHCGNKQCIPLRKECNRLSDCANGADELFCGTKPSAPLEDTLFLSLPSYVFLSKYGLLELRRFKHRRSAGYFRCSSIDLYLSYELRCNGVYDCPGREDEDDCDNYKCLGFYRCRGSKICLHPVDVCDEDAVAQCPLGDDELLCDFTCPDNCTCYGLAAYCDHRSPVHSVTQLRFLEARGSGLTLADVASNKILIHLGLGSCGLRKVSNSTFPNIRSLDISDNLLTRIGGYLFQNLPNLQSLIVSGNPLVSCFLTDADRGYRFDSVKSIEMSRVPMSTLDFNAFTPFPNLQTLNISGNGIEHLYSQGLSPLTRLISLDVRDCPVTYFSRDAIRGLRNLKTIRADSYKLCCPEVLPSGFNLINCHAPRDEISSCDSLLRSDAYRVVLSVFAVLALIGNLGSFAYRVIVHKAGNALGFGVFVTHLSVSDFLMGLYLAIIGVADRVYKGSYLWEDVSWRNSTACSVAGFLSLASSEVSALLICLLTLDRFLVLRFPLSQLRFHRRSAQIACAVIWIFGFVLSAIPLLPATSHWRFYNHKGICIPLPITKNKFPGQLYSFNVMIVFNFVLFLLVAAGQLSIYHSAMSSSKAVSQTHGEARCKDLAVARRLITVAVSDFCCWFPIGLLGLLSSSGSPISVEVNVALAILVLPLNSALNPFLYAFKVIMERRRQEAEKRLLRSILSAQKPLATN